MNRLVLGAVSALLLAGAGMFWWQGQATTDASAPPPPPMPAEVAQGPDLDYIPTEDGEGMFGPALPQVDEDTREEKRFNRLDRNRDNLISRNEVLQPRVAAFRKLDKDGNNLLTFEEWAYATVDKFKGADANADLFLTREEFATTRPKDKPRVTQKCSCK